MRTTRRRKSHIGGHANHDRWVISYADFVTLLLAFFVVMFATAKADSRRFRALSESVKSAFSQGNTADLQAAIADVKRESKPGTVLSSKSELGTSEDVLTKALSEEIKKGEVELHMEPRGLVISFKQGAVFASGDDTVKASAMGTMAKVADVMRQLPNQIRLEGHTDNIPIHNEHFRNNWELSSARSTAILEVLNNSFGIDVHRLSVSGYGDVAPIASNLTEEGRTKNRRADVVILSSQAARSEPARTAP